MKIYNYNCERLLVMAILVGDDVTRRQLLEVGTWQTGDTMVGTAVCLLTNSHKKTSATHLLSRLFHPSTLVAFVISVGISVQDPAILNER